MKNTLYSLIVLTLIFNFSLVFCVNAKVAQNQNMNQEQNQETNQEQNTSTAGQQNQEQNQEINQEQNQEQEQIQEPIKNQDKNQQGQTNAQQHRSAVANFVHELLEIADREGGIGEQVRNIAQQQNQSASDTIRAMETVQTRSRIKTFFIGTDYKNLGALRSQIVQTRNRLEQLNKLMENIKNEGDKTELQNQIQTLEQEQVKIENFIRAQENQFSLFGWLVKFFNK